MLGLLKDLAKRLKISCAVFNLFNKNRLKQNTRGIRNMDLRRNIILQSKVEILVN
ncbi:MAG: ribosome-binding protein aMBF1 (putative translation factor) [Saprospiraceae bacterium]|jgi:ribosome-binding protein aMBF1 (putative translation factor)